MKVYRVNVHDDVSVEPIEITAPGVDIQNGQLLFGSGKEIVAAFSDGWWFSFELIGVEVEANPTAPTEEVVVEQPPVEPATPEPVAPPIENIPLEPPPEPPPVTPEA